MFPSFLTQLASSAFTGWLGPSKRIWWLQHRNLSSRDWRNLLISRYTPSYGIISLSICPQANTKKIEWKWIQWAISHNCWSNLSTVRTVIFSIVSQTISHLLNGFMKISANLMKIQQNGNSSCKWLTNTSKITLKLVVEGMDVFSTSNSMPVSLSEIALWASSACSFKKQSIKVSSDITKLY